MNISKTIKITTLILYTVVLLSYNNQPIVYSKEEKTASNEELMAKIEKLEKLLNEKFFIIQHSGKLIKKEIKENYTTDVKTLIGLKLKLFYSFGKIYGYAVFISKKNNFAIVDNVNLKLTFYHNKFMSGKKIFYIKIKKQDFSMLTLARGDRVIAFHIKNIEHGKLLPEGNIIPVTAECSHLKTRTELFIY